MHPNNVSTSLTLFTQQAANTELQDRIEAGASTDEVDIEHIPDKDAPHIEFNIAMLPFNDEGTITKIACSLALSLGCCKRVCTCVGFLH